MRIYCQYSGLKVLTGLKTGKGDLSTEVAFYTALSRFADVYYSGTKFDPNKPNFGLSEYPESIASRASKPYDVYYIRGSAEAFDAVPEGKPRICMATPHDLPRFKKATAICTTTLAWEKFLRSGTKIQIINPYGYPFTNVVTIHQTVLDTFKPLQNHPKTRALRKQFGGKFVIGIFGRCVESNYPHAFMAVYPWLVKVFPKVRTVIGTIKGDWPSDSLPNALYRTFPHEEMPYVVSACDLIYVPGKGFTWPVRGSTRCLEAGACGVPILMCYSPARAEHLGEDYELFLPDQHPMKATSRDVRALKAKLKLVIRDDQLRKKLRSELPRKTEFYHVGASAKRLRKLFKGLLSES